MQVYNQASMIEIPRHEMGTNFDIKTVRTLNPNLGIMTRLK